MRILYSHYLADDDHPAVRIIRAIGDGLRSLGHQVAIHRSFGSAPQPASGEGSETAPPDALKAAIKGKLWFAKAMARNSAMVRRDRAAVACFRPQVVLGRQDAYCWSMPMVCRRLGVPLVTYADAPVAYETRLFGEKTRWHPPRLVEAIEQWGLKHSRAVVTVSRPAARQLERYQLDVPVHVVPNGVHPERFPQLSPAQREQQRKALRLKAPLVIGFEGTFRPFHGIDRLRELMLQTSARTDVQWLLIGDGPERAGLQKAVLGKVPAVFLGMPPAERVGRLLNLIDVAVAPHVQTPGHSYLYPQRILEFAAAGCAVIASDQGDIPRLLADGRAGLLVDRPDQAAWQAALSRLLDDRQYRQSLGKAARRFVLSNFTWQHTVRRVEQVLREVAAHKPAEPDQVQTEPSDCERRLALCTSEKSTGKSFSDSV